MSDRLRYSFEVRKLRLGYVADVSATSDGMGPLAVQGPLFWRMTLKGAKRRAERHIRNRTRHPVVVYSQEGE